MISAALLTPYLDTIIALVLVYALLSILVSILLEAWNKRIKLRGVFLQKVVYRMLDDPLNHNYGHLIYQHPIINAMRRDGNSYPHYIPAEGFANALIDVLAEQAVTLRYEAREDGTYAGVRVGAEDPLQVRLNKGIDGMAESELKQLFRNFMDRHRSADGVVDVDGLKLELGRWFDGNMERAGGEYKNDQKHKLVFLGFLVAVGMNVDSLHLTRMFLLDTDLRDRMVAEADAVAERYTAEREALGTDSMATLALMRSMGVRHDGVVTDSLLRIAAQRLDTAERRALADAEAVVEHVRSWQLPLGWNTADAPLSWFCDPRPVQLPEGARPSQRAVLRHLQERNTPKAGSILQWLVGIFITGWSLSQGAPFWFEALVKLINIRRSGVKPQTTDERQHR
ncbi:MAG: hypothetical protein IPG35_17425 [Flavobacteriales bacterium]|nr:hypothetical protein [Flavobacteriales bacterium]MBK9700954.1 hypothetical protein [Flavobacteriales bacterium]